MLRHLPQTSIQLVLDIVRRMYWPLFGGFIAFVLLALVLGWILDPDRRHDADGH